MADIGNLYLLLSQDINASKSYILWPSTFITLEHNGKSFGWKFSPAPKTEKVIEKIYEVLSQYHIESIKTLEQTLETLHLTLIKEIVDEYVFEKGKRYIELHYANSIDFQRTAVRGMVKIFIKENNQWKEWLNIESPKSLSL